MTETPKWQDQVQLSPQELRTAAEHASPAIAQLLRAMAQAQEGGDPLSPAGLQMDPTALLQRAEVLADEMDLLVRPMSQRIGALRARLDSLQPARAQTLAHLSPMLEVVQGTEARGHLSQAIAQLSSGSDARALGVLLERMERQILKLPAQLQRATKTGQPGRLEDLKGLVQELTQAEQSLRTSQDSLYGASASLGLSASAASQDQDPATPWLLALRASLIQSLDGQALEAWEQAFDSATKYRSLQVAQLAARALTPAALNAEDYQRAALIQHLIAELSPPGARFHPRLQQALLLSKVGGFNESIDALLSECQDIVPMDIPSRARLWLSSGEIRERQGRLDDAKKCWKRLISLPKAKDEAPILQARGLAYLGEAMLPDSKATRYLEAALERGEALADWATVALVLEAWHPVLREQDPAAAQSLAQHVKAIAQDLAPERLGDLDAWLA